MGKKALIENSVVTAVSMAPDKNTETWRDVPDSVVPGMIESPPGTFSAPVQQPTAEDIREEAERQVDAIAGPIERERMHNRRAVLLQVASRSPEQEQQLTEINTTMDQIEQIRMDADNAIGNP